MGCILSCVTKTTTGKAVGRVGVGGWMVVVCKLQAAKSRANKMSGKVDLYIFSPASFVTKQMDDFADKSSLFVDFSCCVMRCTNVTPDDERGTGEVPPH